MLSLVIRYTTIILCGNYIYQKLLNTKTKPRYSTYFCSFTILSTTLFSYFLSARFQYLVLPALFLVTFIYLICTTSNRAETIFTSIIISYGITYSFFYLAAMIVYVLFCIPLYMLFHKTLHFLCSQILIAIIQCILCTLPFRTKRLQKGMPFLHNHLFSNIGTFISCIILFCCMFISSIGIQASSFTTQTALLLIPFIFIFSIFIFMWWRNQIQQSYLLQLKDREYKRLEEQFKFFAKKISILEKENEELSKLIHRDNKLIPSMQFALHELLEHILNEATTKQVEAKGTALLMQLEQEMKDRNGIVMKLSHPDQKLASSNIDSIDYLLTYMQQKCIKKHILLEVSFFNELSEMLKNSITETDCLTILADLLENAMIAVNSAHKAGHVLLEIGKGETFYEIHVWDDGIPFPKEVLFLLGKKRFTTHKEDGGSGIGTMNTYSLLQTYHASLIIDERIDIHSLYSKKVSIVFDQLQQYRLLTNRTKEHIQYLSQRTDLIINDVEPSQ